MERLNETGSSKYKLHATFMRLLYTIDRIDIALDCFKDEKLKEIFMQDLASSMIILDKLIEDKQYQQALDFFNSYLRSLEKIPSSILNALTFVFFKIVC